MEKISIDGIWELKGDDLEIKANVPGEIHLDLKNAGIIKEPFIGKNLFELRKYEGKKWIYKKDFEIHQQTVNKSKRVEIIFEGIDCNSKIRINDKKIGQTNNSFIAHTFDITDIISSKNKIEIEINDGLSNIPKKVPERYIPFLEETWHKDDLRRLFVRKPQFVFGWDWTERIITCGLWRPVYLNFYKNIAIRDIWIKKLVNKKVEIEVELENFTSYKIKTKIICKIEKEKIFYKEVPPGISKHSFLVNLPFLAFWYPWNLGIPYLYNFEVFVYTDEIEDKKILKFGLRKIEIIQEKDEYGRSFIFSVNGKKVFCRGANWVPADTIFPRVTKEKYKKLIELALQQNFNMFRVWGGGIYEDPYFYQLCDEKGIMVWQDFMFACGLYPDDNKCFMENVSKEIEFVVKSLRNHPSIVLWCGNNENYTIYYDYVKKKNPNRIFYGIKIYEKLIPEKLKKLDPDRFYWPSSDYSPTKQSPKDMSEGDRHSWYIPEIDLEEYEKKGERYFFLQDKARFVSEFGRISFSNFKSIKEFITGKSINLKDNDFIFHSNTMGKPEDVIKNLVKFYGERIKNLSDQDIIKFSYLHQGMTLEFALKYYAARKYKTGGTLFWMYNDSWPTSSSWVSVDYYLRKHPLFWFVKRAYSDVSLFILPSFITTGNDYFIYCINHKYQTINLQISYGIKDIFGEKVFEKTKELKVKGNYSQLIFHGKIEEKLKKGDFFIYAYMKFGGKTIYDICPVSKSFKNLPLEEIKLKKENKSTILTSKVYHICVEVNGDIEDNYFSLIPGIDYCIKGKVRSIKSFNYLFNGNT